MEVNVINLEGVIIEQIKLPIKTTPQCVSKFQYLYNHATQGIKVYNPNNYIDYKLYVDNLNDSIFYLVDPKSNITLDYATFQLTIELPVNPKPTPIPCATPNKKCSITRDCGDHCVCWKQGSEYYGKCITRPTPAPTPIHGKYPITSSLETCSSIATTKCGPGTDPSKVICNLNTCYDLIINNSIIVYDCGGKNDKKTTCPLPSNIHGSYVVKHGDTCNSIAFKMCGLTTDPELAICDFHKICKKLQAGKRIYYDCALNSKNCPPPPPTPVPKPTPVPTPACQGQWKICQPPLLCCQGLLCKGNQCQ